MYEKSLQCSLSLSCNYGVTLHSLHVLNQAFRSGPNRNLLTEGKLNS